MAYATAFEQCNHVFDKPPDLTVDQCEPLQVHYDPAFGPEQLPTIISCHKLTAGELAEVNRTGRIWLGVISSARMSPVWISGHNPFFITPESLST